MSTPPQLENQAFDTFIKELLVDPSTVTQDVLDTINALYPANDSSLGAPFNTGDSLFDRAEAWYTDNMYLAARRLLFNKAAPLQPLFAYWFKEFIPGNDPSLGGKWNPCGHCQLSFTNDFLRSQFSTDPNLSCSSAPCLILSRTSLLTR